MRLPHRISRYSQTTINCIACYRYRCKPVFLNEQNSEVRLRFVMFLIVVSLTIQTCGFSAELDETSKAVKDLFLRVGSARERIAAYECDIQLKTTANPASKKTLVNEGVALLKIEYVGFSNHFLVARSENTNNDTVEKWTMAGRSENYRLSGCTKEKVLIENWTTDRIQMPPHFDPRSTGFGSYGNYFCALPFEHTISGYLGRRHQSLQTKVKKLSDSRVEYSTNEPLNIVFDSNADYWPVNYSIWTGQPDATTWTLELGKHNEYHVPVSATIECALGYRVDMIFKWKKINRSIETGLASGRAWAILLQADLEDQRRIVDNNRRKP